MGIILRNCKLHKTQLLPTNLAKAVTVRLKLFHVEQFRFAPTGPLTHDADERIGTLDGRENPPDAES